MDDGVRSPQSPTGRPGAAGLREHPLAYGRAPALPLPRPTSPTRAPGAADAGSRSSRSTPTTSPAPAPDGRPWVIVDMIASIDGATAVAGRSGGLGGPGRQGGVPRPAGRARRDRWWARPPPGSRATAPVRLDDEVRARRLARGQAAVPRLALVSGPPRPRPRGARCSPTPTPPPLVLTTEAAGAEHATALRGPAEIVVAGTDRWTWAPALADLGARGARTGAGARAGPASTGSSWPPAWWTSGACRWRRCWWAATAPGWPTAPRGPSRAAGACTACSSRTATCFGDLARPGRR